MRTRSGADDWPTPVATVHGRAAAGMRCLSDLPIDQRRAALTQMRQQQPEMAGFVGRMGQTFGKLRLYVDDDTAQALGVTR